MSTKIQYINALRSFGIQDEEMHNLTIHQMAEKLSELRKNAKREATPDKPKNFNVIEITRSYSRKRNLGNYETEDYFSSRKAEVRTGDDMQAVSNYLAYSCKIDVETQTEKEMSNKDNAPF